MPRVLIAPISYHQDRTLGIGTYLFCQVQLQTPEIYEWSLPSMARVGRILQYNTHVNRTLLLLELVHATKKNGVSWQV